MRDLYFILVFWVPAGFVAQLVIDALKRRWPSPKGFVNKLWPNTREAFRDRMITACVLGHLKAIGALFMLFGWLIEALIAFTAPQQDKE